MFIIFAVCLTLKLLVMPGRDKTGPNGAGSMSGRQMGDCTNDKYQNTGFFRPGRGVGMGKHGRQGFGMRNHNRFASGEFADSNFVSLKNRLNLLEEEIDRLKRNSHLKD